MYIPRVWSVRNTIRAGTLISTLALSWLLSNFQKRIRYFHKVWTLRPNFQIFFHVQKVLPTFITTFRYFRCNFKAFHETKQFRNCFLNKNRVKMTQTKWKEAQMRQLIFSGEKKKRWMPNLSQQTYFFFFFFLFKVRQPTNQRPSSHGAYLTKPIYK